MLEMKVTIAPTTELVTVLDKLAAAIGGGGKGQEMVLDAPKASAAPAPVQTGTPSVNPVASTVPTAAPQYTVEMLADAGTTLVDAGKMAELLRLLADFGVNAITDLKPETYGAVASKLRALGAQI
jgi:hypothetical protein